MENHGDVNLALQAGGVQHWPYLFVLVRIALAVGLGLFVGMERERRGKEAGIRTFSFAALLGCLGGLLGDAYALVALALLGILIIFLNWHRLITNQTAELTTSVALLVVGVMGVLCGKGHNFTPVTVGVLTAALLAWKERMTHFSVDLTANELRSAILLAILAFVIYPVLPAEAIDPWGLVQPRSAWVTVLLIAGVGFVNYILLKLYGMRGAALAGFLGGLVNSSVTVAELALRSHTNEGDATGQKDSPLIEATYQGVLLTTVAMLLRNSVVLGFLSFQAFLQGALVPLLLMLIATGILVLRTFLHHRNDKETTLEDTAPVATAEVESEAAGEKILPVKSKPKKDAASRLFRLESPFSLSSTLKFGLAFLALHVAGTLAQRFLGAAGFYAVSVLGGLFSSSSAVAAAGTLAAHGDANAQVAGMGAVLASITSVLVSLVLVARVGGQPVLTARLGRSIALVTLAGLIGAGVQVVIGR